MQTVSLSWQLAWQLSTGLAVGGAAGALVRRPAVRTVAAFARETAVIGYLYGLWQLAGQLSSSPSSTTSALDRAAAVRRFERDLPLPTERTMQHLVLGFRHVVEACNLYYATMHVPMMIVFLIWLFWRHRDRYRPVRQVMAWTTLGCLLVQLIPVAPPRMLPGIVDTAALYDQSVYSNGLPIDQLSAMPSVHVAWASLVGFYTWRISTSRWRWIGPAHTAVTVFVVVVTGNHWWLDGIVAVAILCTCAWGVAGVRAAWRATWRVVRPAVLARISPSRRPVMPDCAPADDVTTPPPGPVRVAGAPPRL